MNYEEAARLLDSFAYAVAALQRARYRHSDDADIPQEVEHVMEIRKKILHHISKGNENDHNN